MFHACVDVSGVIKAFFSFLIDNLRPNWNPKAFSKKKQEKLFFSSKNSCYLILDTNHLRSIVRKKRSFRIKNRG